eukprot:669362-Pelagomonas_calceolata.AAC.2
MPAQATAEQALRDLRVEKEGLAQALAEAQQQHKTAKEAAEVADGRGQALEAELAEDWRVVFEKLKACSCFLFLSFHFMGHKAQGCTLGYSISLQQILFYLLYYAWAQACIGSYQSA